MTTIKTIVFSSDFTPYPGGRYRDDGEGSAEVFRDDVVMPILRQGHNVKIVLDKKTLGFPSSFLEEVFGGLVRLGFTPEQLRERMTLEADMEYRSSDVEKAWRFVNEAYFGRP